VKLICTVYLCTRKEPFEDPPTPQSIQIIRNVCIFAPDSVCIHTIFRRRCRQSGKVEVEQHRKIGIVGH
jgi:hypothetical protein